MFQLLQLLQLEHLEHGTLLQLLHGSIDRGAVEHKIQEQPAKNYKL